MRLSKYCIVAMLLPLLRVISVTAQTKTITPLHFNNAVPDVALTLVNYTATHAKLSDFKGKLVILDFWSTRCGACIHHFAELDSLQHLCNNKICILAVSSKPAGENSQTVKAFIKGYKQRISGGFTLPAVVNDTILYKLFPHNSIPHYVWIDKNGKFFAVTSGGEVNAENISWLLNNQKITLKYKAEETDYELLQPPQIDLNNGSSAEILSRSLLTKYIDGLAPVTGYDGDAATNKVTKLFAINVTALGLYKHAYLQNEILPNNRIVFEIPSAEDFDIAANWDSLKYTKAYCYELIMPSANYAALQKRMQDDLYAYFKIKAVTEKRNTECLVLSVADTALLDTTTAGEPGNTLYENIKTERVIVNQPLSVLTERLNELMPIPVIDESGIKANINLRLPPTLTDVNALQTALEKQGIKLTKETRMSDFFVLKADK